ncbi:hypothetical protein BT69DRAFT_1276793 [Atractiella rhizophila]|nr:hypothetical protein BT69DRAFT_1276793 [Atractiella rhizophila]
MGLIHFSSSVVYSKPQEQDGKKNDVLINNLTTDQYKWAVSGHTYFTEHLKKLHEVDCLSKPDRNIGG